MVQNVPLPTQVSLHLRRGRVADVHFGLATLPDLGGVTAGTKPRNETYSVLLLKQAAA
jgi:hypothetical protein